MVIMKSKSYWKREAKYWKSVAEAKDAYWREILRKTLEELEKCLEVRDDGNNCKDE